MAYTWITPKTDWNASTYITYTDYNRIRNNLLYINDQLNIMFPSKTKTLDLGDAKTGYDNVYHASEFNAFEDALESFTRVGESVNIGTRNFYKANNAFIGYADLNRIESCCLRWKNYEPSIDSASISPDVISIGVGETKQLAIIVAPSTAPYTVTWSCDKPYQATVSTNGLVTGLHKGGFTITATVNSGGKTFVLKATGSVASGSYFFFNNKMYYYDLVVIGYQSVFQGNSGVLFLMPRYRTSALQSAWGVNQDPTYPYEQWSPSLDCEWYKTINVFMDNNFSKQLKNVMQGFNFRNLQGMRDDYSELGYRVLYYQASSGGSGGSLYLNAYLPTMSFYERSTPPNADPQDSKLQQFYPLKGVEEKHFTDALIEGESLISETDKGQLVQVRLKDGNNYTVARLKDGQLYNCAFDEVVPLRPVFGILPSRNPTIYVHPTPNEEGVYIIDWTNSPTSKLASSLPLGSIIRDDSGT